MKNRILLASILGVAAGMSTVSASFTYSQKNFMAQRPTLVNGGMEYPLWHQHAYDLKAKGIRSNIQAVAFYQHSQKGADVGKYFGVNGSNSFKVNDAAAVTGGTADLNGAQLIHQQGAANFASGSLTLSPEQERYGLRLDYFQDLTHPFSKMFFRASLPIEHISSKVKLGLSSDAVSTEAALLTKEFSLSDYFKGLVSDTTTAGNLQTALTKAKMVNRSTNGVSDLDLSLGYKYLDKEDKHVYLSLDVTVPTGQKVKGDYLFAPQYGNGRHVALGGRIHTGFDFWKNDKATVKLEGSYRYAYLFEGTENRTLSLKDQKYSQYYMAGKVGQAANTPLFPAANILTMPLSVKPGSMLETTTAIAFCCSGFTVNAGYNSFWKDQESVWVKSFSDNVYGIAETTYETNRAEGGRAQETLTRITSGSLDVASVKTPALFSHKVFTGLGYTGHLYKKYPASVGVGGSYDFGTSNADLENYAVWLKTCFSF